MRLLLQRLNVFEFLFQVQMSCSNAFLFSANRLSEDNKDINQSLFIGSKHLIVGTLRYPVFH